jgi:hypothetical protein
MLLKTVNSGPKQDGGRQNVIHDSSKKISCIKLFSSWTTFLEFLFGFVGDYFIFI